MSKGIPIIWDDCWLLLAAFVSLSASALRNDIHKKMAFTIYAMICRKRMVAEVMGFIHECSRGIFYFVVHCTDISTSYTLQSK